MYTTINPVALRNLSKNTLLSQSIVFWLIPVKKEPKLPKSLFTSRALGSLSVTCQTLHHSFQGSGMYRRQKLISHFSPPRFFHFSSLDFSYARHLLTSFQCKRFSCQNNISNGIFWSTLLTLSCVFLRPSSVSGRAPNCKAMFFGSGSRERTNT